MQQTNSDQPRHPKGAPTGGQWRPGEKHAPAITLNDPTATDGNGDVWTGATSDGTRHRVEFTPSGFEAVIDTPDGPARAGVHESANEAEAAAILAAQARNRDHYGDVSNVTTGTRTPWGEAQHVTRPAPGIASVITQGHGGLKLSPERNRTIPPALRKRSGWYEEDVEASIVAMYHPEAFTHQVGDDHSLDDVRTAHTDAVRAYFTEGYEAATGETVPVDESYTKQRQVTAERQAAFLEAHRDDFVTDDGGHSDVTPDGWSFASAVKASTGERREFLVPKDFFADDHNVFTPRLIDPSVHVDITDALRAGDPEPEPAPVPVHNLGVDTSHLAPATAARAIDGLNKQYQFRDGGVRTLRDHLERVGVVSKHVSETGGARSRWVETGDRGFIQVTKPVYDSLTNVPEPKPVDTPERKARAAVERAQKGFDTARTGTERREARATLNDARRTHDELVRANEARDRDEQDRRSALKRAAVAAAVTAHQAATTAQ